MRRLAGSIRAFRIVSLQWRRTALSGEGARLYGGRWNPPGFRCVYLAESRALALLEILVHLTPATRRLPLWLVEVEFPASLVQDAGGLPPDWKAHPASPATQSVGRNWLEAAGSAVLRTPSVLVPEEFNYLLNPSHPDADQIVEGASARWQLDQRLAHSAAHPVRENKPAEDPG